MERVEQKRVLFLKRNAAWLFAALHLSHQFKKAVVDEVALLGKFRWAKDAAHLVLFQLKMLRLDF